MLTISSSTIQSWERFYRANFVNSLTGFKSVSLIGTIDAEQKTNLAIFSSLVHIGSDPALVGFINRPVEAAPHTLSNIRTTGEYTVNQIHPMLIPTAHQTSAKYPAGVSEFDELGLTPEYFQSFRAPFVKESRVKYALALQEIIPITLNNTFLVIGKIEHVLVTDEILTADGFLELDRASTICSNGIDGYYSTQLIDRYRYAKPGIKPERIERSV
jgi:flavin reductase (DIM6/NTAB) family NADH-FMN oxidoreductase RutF